MHLKAFPSFDTRDSKIHCVFRVSNQTLQETHLFTYQSLIDIHTGFHPTGCWIQYRTPQGFSATNADSCSKPYDPSCLVFRHLRRLIPRNHPSSSALGSPGSCLSCFAILPLRHLLPPCLSSSIRNLWCRLEADAIHSRQIIVRIKSEVTGYFRVLPCQVEESDVGG